MMKNTVSIVALALIVAISLSFKGNEMLDIGSSAPLQDYKMTDVASGNEMTLKGLKKENGLLVIFSCNTCPFVLAWEDQYPELGKITEKQNIGMVLVNSNEAKRDNEDSKEAMITHYKEQGYNTPYVMDKDHKLADAFGAKTTPHVYLFNSDMELVYRGSINDKFEDRDKKASNFYLEKALKQLVKSGKPDPATTREIGCSIKRVKA